MFLLITVIRKMMMTMMIVMKRMMMMMVVRRNFLMETKVKKDKVTYGNYLTVKMVSFQVSIKS